MVLEQVLVAACEVRRCCLWMGLRSRWLNLVDTDYGMQTLQLMACCACQCQFEALGQDVSLLTVVPYALQVSQPAGMAFGTHLFRTERLAKYCDWLRGV